MDVCEEDWTPTWSIRTSIALELDMALSVLNGHYPPGSLPPYAAVLAEAAAGWRDTWAGVLWQPGRNVNLLEAGAMLAGVLFEDDYSRATLAIRELTLDAALAALPPASEEPPSPEDRLAARLAHHEAALFAGLGFPQAGTARQAAQAEQAARHVARILQGGDLHDRFWHWLDRFYYELYGPWRRERAGIMAQEEARLSVALETGRSGPPPIDWLPPQNPLLRQPELRAALETGHLSLACWLEPFGLTDSWLVYSRPGCENHPGLFVSCAEPGQIYANFQAAAAELAARAAALGDPTRLIILRIIRHFGMINTEIAEYLGVSRPTVSVHARILREAGLIRSRQQGREVRHELAPEEVRRLFRDLERFLDLPDEE